MPDERSTASRASSRSAAGCMRFALYGDEAVVDHRFAKIKAAFERIPGAEVWGTKHVAREEIPGARAPGRAHPGRRARTSTGTT